MQSLKKYKNECYTCSLMQQHMNIYVQWIVYAKICVEVWNIKKKWCAKVLGQGHFVSGTSGCKLIKLFCSLHGCFFPAKPKWLSNHFSCEFLLLQKYCYYRQEPGSKLADSGRCKGRGELNAHGLVVVLSFTEPYF